MPTREEILSYLGIDYADPMVNRNIDRLIKTTNAILKGSIGVDYPENDPRVKEVALMIIGDLYDNRDSAGKESANTRKLLDDLMLQLRLEMRTNQ